MSVPENASLMPFYTLTKGQKVRFTALDAVTGVVVGAVIISGMTIGVEAAATDTPTQNIQDYMPIFTYGPAA